MSDIATSGERSESVDIRWPRTITCCDAPQVPDVGERIASQDDEVGLAAGHQGAERVGAEEERRITRGREECIGVARSQPAPAVRVHG